MADRTEAALDVRARDVAEAVDGTLFGDPDSPVEGVCPVDAPERGKLCFARDSAILEGTDPTKAGAVLLCPLDVAGLLSGTRIAVADPRMAFATAVRRFFAAGVTPGIAASAHIDPSAEIGANVAIGEGCVIGPNVRLGEGTQIRNNVVLGPSVRIGARCIVGSNSVIGEVGFGMARDEEGRGHRIPHLGSVVIGDDVEIGALSSIAAGTIAPTRLANGVRIDDQVFLAHNVQLEENVMVIACAEISGSVRVGRNTWIGPNVSIRDGVTIPPDSLIGIGSTVVKTLEEPEVYAGLPARLMKKLDG